MVHHQFRTQRRQTRGACCASYAVKGSRRGHEFHCDFYGARMFRAEGGDASGKGSQEG